MTFLVRLTLLFSTVLALPALASTPLQDRVLRNGRSRLVSNPDYRFKLTEAILLNSGYDEKKDTSPASSLRWAGIVVEDSDEAYALDREIRAILDPIFNKYLPGQIPEYNLLFVKEEVESAQIFIGHKRRSIPTFLFTSGLLRHVPSLDKFLGVVFHELAHVLQMRRHDESWFDRALKSMPHEDQADGFAVRMLVETGHNPLAFSQLMERLIPETGGHWPGRAGFSTHPPTETRLTRINALIEKASDRVSFREAKPLTGVLKKVSEGASPAYSSTTAEHEAIVAPTLGEALAALGEGWKVDQEASVEGLTKVIDRLLARVTPASASAWGARASWNSVTKGLRVFWYETKGRRDPRVRQFFFETERKLALKARELGRTFVSDDQIRRTQFQNFKAAQTADQASAWANLIELPDDGKSDPKFKYYGLTHGYSFYQDPALVREAVDHYISLVPQLEAHAWAAFDRGDQKTLLAIARLRDVFAASFLAWSWVSSESNAFERWDPQIAELPVSHFAKLLFFPSIAIDYRHEWEMYVSYHNEDGQHGEAIFPNAMEFIHHPEKDGRDFANFHRNIRLLKAMHPASPMKFDFSENHFRLNYERHGLPLGFSNNRKWLVKVLNQLRFTEHDAIDLLEEDSYWEVHQPRDRKSIKDQAHNISDGAREIFEYFTGEQTARRHVKRMRRDLEDTVDRFFEETFYHRPEYRADPAEAEDLQVLVYENLKRDGQLPKALPSEIELWMKFAKRGVTTFTDEWAEILIRKLERLPSRVGATSLAMEKMFFSNLVWSLKARERLALLVYSVDNSEIVRGLQHRTVGASNKALGLVAPKRSDYVASLVNEIRREFPEKSEERVLVVDRIAERIHADAAETVQMMKLIDQGQKELTDVSATRSQAFGVRFYSQIFSEMKNYRYKQEDRLEVFDFLLGKTDRIPRLFEKNYRFQDDREEFREVPALYGVRRTVKPYRIRSAFQTLSVEARTVLLDPFFLGQNGVIENPEGRQWIIDTLVPKDAFWRDMAVDLVDGYREGLIEFGQGHLKTMFISYLVACSARAVMRSDYSRIFSHEAGDVQPETQVGKILKSLFSANAALQKIGQRVHSSNIFEPNINRSIASLKDSASRVMREDQHAWIENAALCDGICKVVKIYEELGNASVKAVLKANVAGQSSVLYLIKPNAHLRGVAFFRMIEHAVQYAVDRGHVQLKLVQGMIRRARETFVRETDLTLEREAGERMKALYSPGSKYGDGFQFITPEFIDTVGIMDSKLTAAVEAIEVRRFADLDAKEQTKFAQAVAEKESEIHRLRGNLPPTDKVTFEKDRHEGNYLLVTDHKVLERFGSPERRMILVIDFAQIADIDSSVRDKLLDAIALIGALQSGMIDRAAVAQKLVIPVTQLLVTRVDGLLSAEVLSAHLDAAADLSTGLKPGEMLSRVLAYLESDGFVIRDDVLDYLTSLSTMQTWDARVPNNAFTSGLTGTVFARCATLLTSVN